MKTVSMGSTCTGIKDMHLLKHVLSYTNNQENIKSYKLKIRIIFGSNMGNIC